MTLTQQPPDAAAQAGTPRPRPSIAELPSTTLLAMAARDTLAVASGMCAFGLVLGITAAVLGRSLLANMVGAGTIYGGSAQLTTTTLLAHGSGLALAVVSGVIVQLRLLLYSAAMGERFAGHGRAFRWLAPHFIIDQTFIVAQNRPELVGRAFRGYWLRLGTLVLAVWTSSVALGLLLAPHVPPLPHLTLVCAAMFVGLLAPRLTSSPAVAAAVAGASTSLVIGYLVPSLGIISGALAGMVAGSIASRRKAGQEASS